MKLLKNSLGAALGVSLLISACSNAGSGADSAGTDTDTGAGEAAAGDGYKIALISKGFQHQFWQAVKQGAEEAAAEHGASITFNGPASETEIDAQLQMFQTAIESNPDAIGYAALDPEACVPYMEQAKEANIPVVMFDTSCNSDYPVSFAATDNIQGGATAAEHMVEALGGKGKVGVVGHSQVASTGVDRRDGFVNYIEENAPDIEIVDIQYGDGDHLKSADIAKAMATANPDLGGIYGTNEGSAIGSLNGVRELGDAGKDIVVIGFDSGEGQINAIKEGIQYGAVTQDPVGMGRLTVESAIKAIEGEELPKIQDTGSYWYDKDNLDDPQIAAALYQ